MEFDFLTPLDLDLIDFINQLSSQHLGNKITLHTNDDFPNLDKINLAIIGVPDNRGAKNDNEQIDLSSTRKELYKLFPGNWNQSIADLGNISNGDSINDTYYAVQSVVSFLIKKKILPIIIGGSQDITYALYRAYDNLEQMVNLVAIDSKFDFGKTDTTIDNESYLSKIILDQPNNLFNYSNIGYQTYYNSQEEIDLIDKMYFEAYRLGEISNNISLAEPVLRDADIVSLDLNSIKSSSSNNFNPFIPNGFNGKEICSLARYAGISDKVSLFGIFNQSNPNNEATLISQIIWYFIEGYQYRSGEYPFGNKENYIKYIVPIEEDEILFFKSNITERWWIEIPFFTSKDNKLKKHTLLPCSHEEYLSACNQEIPERWWKAQRRNMV